LDPADFKRGARNWEQECLRQLEHRAFENPGHTPGGWPEIVRVFLEGSHPETRICVRYVSRSLAEERTKCFRLWKEPFVGPDTGPHGRETTGGVALLIHVNIMEEI
jgi:hypothetical protein